MNDKSVSVIMPAYNAERFVAAALGSLLKEESLGLDIIVVDDGSTDRTAAIVAGMAAAHPCIRFIGGPHAGVSAARNAGLAAVPPEVRFITFLDSDDLSAPGRIARQIALIENNPGTLFVIGHICYFEEIDEESCTPAPGSRTLVLPGTTLGSALFDRRAFDLVGGFAADMPFGEDIDLFLRLLENQAQRLTDEEVSLFYRRHLTNLTRDRAQAKRGFVDAIRRSLARRRARGLSLELGDFFQSREAAEAFNNG